MLPTDMDECYHACANRHLPCWSGGGLYQMAHSFTIKTLGFTKVDHIEDDTLTK